MIACMLVNCNLDFQTVNDYLLHLKQQHDLPVDYRYKCTVLACTQVFSKFYPFKKHIIGHERDICKTPCQNTPIKNPHLANTEITSQSDYSQTTKKQKTEENEELNAGSSNYSKIDRSALNLTLSLHTKNNITRKDVYSIQTDVSEMLAELAHEFEELDVTIENPNEEFKMKSCINKMKNMFDPFNSDHKLFTYLIRTTGLELPKIITVNENAIISNQINLELDTDIKSSYLVVMPIASQIKAFFECNNVYKQTMENMTKLEKSAEISNFVNGSKWKEIRAKYQNDIVIPVWLYSDEFEVNDSQSSHSNRHSVCGIYYSFPTIDQQFSSRLSNIFVAGMIKKVDIKAVGVNKLMTELVHEFKRIEQEGIHITVNNDTIFIRFVMCLLQGDNLGIHSMLLLSSGFNATFYCRFCRRPKELLKTDIREHADCMRRRQDYEEDVEVNRHSDTGITSFSVFNDLPSFHVVENKSADGMHDLFSSGICKYGFEEVLNYCIYSKSFFTIHELNDRRKKIGEVCVDNELLRMPDIRETYISKEKRKSVLFKMTSNEMRHFCHYFTLLVGQFVPQNDPVWKYALNLVELVEMCLKRSFSSQDIAKLRKLIVSHHTMYTDLFKTDLKPKHHFVLHYPSVIQCSGPIQNMMCFRHEAKHKGFKQYAHAISSRKNICFTLCIKSYLQFSHDLLNQCFFKPDVNHNFQKYDIRFRNYFRKLIQPLNLNTQFNLMLSSSVVYKGTSYKTGQFLSKLEHSTMTLYEIIEIISLNNDFYFVLAVWQVSVFNEHFLAYETQGCTQIVDVISIDYFASLPVNVFCINSKFMFRPKITFNE
ncbi:uncharacterized protein LOC134285060 [Aedes albopictus]|uniref:C2H2-type domain-containing protein n=1 Tax=Aedes albopictus TaxID=7160 RepID=A0ABM1YRT1_AEDAL